MSINRRQFLKLAGVSTAIGLGGATVLNGLRKDGLEAAQISPDPRALKAKRWGLVIDVSRLKTDEDYQRCIDACHNLHNVPDHGNPKDEVKWIWKDSYEHTFPTTTEDEYMNSEFKEKQFLLLCN